jgi:hypothetical protein
MRSKGSRRFQCIGLSCSHFPAFGRSIAKSQILERLVQTAVQDVSFKEMILKPIDENFGTKGN